MRYCTSCGSEYQEGVATCADCPEGELVTTEEFHRRGLRRSGERDTREFVRAGTTEDPLSAQAFTDVLERAGIPVFARPGRGGTVDVLTTGNVSGWWELRVPREDQVRAMELIAAERGRIEASAVEAAQAAEEEEREGELGAVRE
jgi:hypothetical protein